jgi:hypothetical protein
VSLLGPRSRARDRSPRRAGGPGICETSVGGACAAFGPHLDPRAAHGGHRCGPALDREGRQDSRIVNLRCFARAAAQAWPDRLRELSRARRRHTLRHCVAGRLPTLVTVTSWPGPSPTDVSRPALPIWMTGSRRRVHRIGCQASTRCCPSQASSESRQTGHSASCWASVSRSSKMPAISDAFSVPQMHSGTIASAKLRPSGVRA